MMHRRQFLEVSAMALATAGLSGAARAAGFKTIDSQVHCYERNRPERPWAATLIGPDEMTGDQMVAAMDAVGVDGAVLVSVFTMYRYDASYVLEIEAKHADRFCLVKPVDTKDPGVAENIAYWRTKKGTVGVRILMRDDVSKDPADLGINAVLPRSTVDWDTSQADDFRTRGGSWTIKSTSLERGRALRSDRKSLAQRRSAAVAGCHDSARLQRCCGCCGGKTWRLSRASWASRRQRSPAGTTPSWRPVKPP